MSMMLPTLTLNGFVSDKTAILTRLFVYFITSYYSQTSLFKNKINSFKRTASIDSDNSENTLETIKTALENLYRGYFDNVKVDLRLIEKNSKTDKDKIITTLVIDVIVNDDNREYRLSRFLNIENGKFVRNFDFIENLY